MIEYTLECVIKDKLETRIVEADGVIRNNLGFVVFYKDIDGNENNVDSAENNKKSIITYNPFFIFSMVSDDEYKNKR